MKLVLVDDDEVLLRTLTRRFKQAGYQVASYSDPCSSELLIAEQGDAYLLDLRFASQSGLDFIQPLRAALPSSRIVLLTGYGSIVNAVQAVKRGADDYLTKPVGFKQLQLALCGRHSLVCHNDDVSDHDAHDNHAYHHNKVLSPDQLEWEHIQRVLAEHDGNISQTARVLGMHRRTLQRKLVKRRP